MSESSYLEQIRQLVELQKVDDEIFEVVKLKENAPRELKELEMRFQAIGQRRDHIQEKVEHLQDQRKRLSQDIEGDNAKMSKSKDKLMQAGNTREYQAMMREMDSMEKIFRTREEEKGALMEELENSTRALNEVTAEYEEVSAAYEQKRQALENTLKKADEDLLVLNDKRRIASSAIPEPKFMRYEFIRKRLEHPVIVNVEDGVCSGCHIAIPPQTFIELQSGQQILSCPNCQRLIFWDQHYMDPDAVPTIKKQKADPDVEDVQAEVETVEEDDEE